MRRDKKRRTKGRMARELVYYCLWMLTAVATWAMILKTAAVLLDRPCDLSDVLVFAGAAARVYGLEHLLPSTPYNHSRPMPRSEGSRTPGQARGDEIG